jgi:hypothetical protein
VIEEEEVVEVVVVEVVVVVVMMVMCESDCKRGDNCGRVVFLGLWLFFAVGEGKVQTRVRGCRVARFWCSVGRENDLGKIENLQI